MLSYRILGDRDNKNNKVNLKFGEYFYQTFEISCIVFGVNLGHPHSKNIKYNLNLIFIFKFAIFFPLTSVF